MNTSPRVASSEKSNSSHQTGLTLIEVLVVVATVFTLAAFILPSVRTARESARRMQCLNNLKNVSLALMNYSSADGGNMPALEDGNYGWPVRLLGYLDRNDLVGNAQFYGNASISAFTCPDDPNNFREPGGLSYVVNAGYGHFSCDATTNRVMEIGTHTAAIDLDGDGTLDKNELSINRSTGVFWRDHPGWIRFRWTFDAIGQLDGTTQTMMFSENLNARGWSSRNTMDIAFVIGRPALTFADNVTGKRALSLRNMSLGPFGINSNHGGMPGECPAPSSYHPGIVNVSFCDGSVRTFSENIDVIIYAEMMTPAGRRYGQKTPREWAY